MTTPRAAPAQASQPPGQAADAQGRTAIDPSENVKALTEAAVRRLDDLREAGEKHAEKIRAVEHQCNDDLRAAEDRHHTQVEELRRELRLAESQRIDAIRAVDVGNVDRAASAADARAAALATTVTNSAEAMRTQVAAAAQAAQAALQQALDPIKTDIADLRRAQYEAQGQKTQVIETRSSVEDLRPIMDQLALLTSAMQQGQGQRTQGVEQRQLVSFGVMLLLAALTVVGAILGTR